jgi:hypothetical protein
MDILSCSKNSQFLHAASRQNWEQLAQLCQLQEKSDKFFKIPS